MDDDKLIKWKLRIVSYQFVMQREYECVNLLVLSVPFIYLFMVDLVVLSAAQNDLHSFK